MDFYTTNPITQKTNMNTEIEEAKDITEVKRSDRLKAAINSINMAKDMLRENENKIEMEILQDIIPLSLLVKIKTASVTHLTIMRQELQEMVEEQLPLVKGKKMYLYRYEAKLTNGNIEYYFHQMYLDPESSLQKQVFDEAFEGTEVEFIHGEDTYRKETCSIMEQLRE